MENKIRLNFNIDKELHTRLKVYAAQNQQTISAILTEAIEELLRKAEAAKDDK